MPPVTSLAPIVGTLRVVFGRLMYIQLTAHYDPHSQIASSVESDLVGKTN